MGSSVSADPAANATTPGRRDRHDRWVPGDFGGKVIAVNPGAMTVTTEDGLIRPQWPISYRHSAPARSPIRPG